jgi:MFS family permease
MILNPSKPKIFSLLGVIIWLIAAVFFLYEFFLRTFIGTLAHQIIQDLNLNPETFTLLGAAYYLMYGLMQVPVGIVTDRFGIKKVLTFAIVTCTISAFLFASSTHFTSAFISRILMGFGSSFAFVCLLVITLTWFPHRYFGVLIGLAQFIGTMGPLLAGGPFIFFVMQLNGNWRLAIMIIGIVGLSLTVLSLIFVKNKAHLNKRSLIILKRDGPISNVLKRLVRNKQVWYISLYSACIYFPMALLGALWGTNYLQTRGLSQHIAADIISIGWLGYAIGCPVLGALSDFMRRRKFALIFPALLATIVTPLITYVTFKFNFAYGFLFFMLGLAAAGQSVGFAIIAEHVSLKARATALGLNNSMILLFSTVFPLVASYFIHHTATTNQLPQQVLAPSNFFIGFSIMPILCCIASILSIFFIKETYCRPQKTTVVLEHNH